MDQTEIIEMELLQLMKTVKWLEASLGKVTTDGASMKEAILKQKTEIQKELDQRTEQLLKEADDLTSSRREILKESLQAHRDILDMKAAISSRLPVAGESYNPEDLNKEVEEGKTATGMIGPLESVSSFPEVFYVSNTDLSSMKRNLRESMGQLIEKVEVPWPAACTDFNDMAYSPFTELLYVSGGASGLWRFTNGRLERVADRTSYGLCISQNGRTLYNVGYQCIQVFELTEAVSLVEVRHIDVHSEVHSVCLSTGGQLALVSCGSRKVLIYDQPESTPEKIQGVFCGGKPLYCTWMGEDKLCVAVAINEGSDKVVCINTKCPCVLWQVDASQCRNMSYIDQLLYTVKVDNTGAEIFSGGSKLATIESKGLRKMFPPASGDGTGALRAVHCYENS